MVSIVAGLGLKLPRYCSPRGLRCRFFGESQQQLLKVKTWLAMDDTTDYEFSVFDEWSLYDEIIERNYMKHAEISAAVSRDLSSMNLNPVNKGSANKINEIWDLGCGCGAMAAKILGGWSVSKYTGVDLSQAGLARIEANLSASVSSVCTESSEIVDFLDQQVSVCPSVILASFSLHHFPMEEIQRVLELIVKHMDSQSRFVWIDTVRQTHETREEFNRRFLLDISTQWTSLLPEQMLEVEEHITQYDFPLDQIERERLLSGAGLKGLTVSYQDPFYTAEIFTRVSAGE